MKKKPFEVPEPKTSMQVRYSIFQVSEKGKLKVPKDHDQYSSYETATFNETYDTPEEALKDIEKYLKNRYANMKPMYELAALAYDAEYVILPITTFKCGDL